MTAALALQPVRRVIAFDLETGLIRPGVHAPKISCLSCQEITRTEETLVEGGLGEGLHRFSSALGEPVLVAHRGAIYRLVEGWLRDPDVHARRPQRLVRLRR
jgi:hypothetical protein